MALPLKIKTTGSVILTNELRTHVEEKLGKLLKFIDTGDTTNLIEVELQTLPARTGSSFRAEMNFSSKGKVLRVEAKGETLHTAFDEVVKEAARRLKHLKTKRRALIRKGAVKVKEFFRKFIR